MEHFELGSIKDLPVMKDIAKKNEIGKQQD
jgi:hypothetical protein